MFAMRMNRVFGFGALALGLMVSTSQAAYIEPLLRYGFDGGTITDSGLSNGASTAADGSYVNDAAATTDTPFGFSTGAMDTNGGTEDYATGGDADKLDNLGSLTITAWVNFQSTPDGNDRIVSKLFNNSGPLTGWDFRMANSGFLGFSELNATGFNTTQSAGSISTGPGWQFIAVSYNAGSKSATFYSGAEAAAVASLGGSSNGAFSVPGDTTADVRVGSTAGSSSDRSPDALFDDVRVYAGALSGSQIETVRREASTLLYQTSFDGTLDTLPTGWGVLQGAAGPSGWRLDGNGSYRLDGSGTGVTEYTGALENGGDATNLDNIVIETSFAKSGDNVGGIIARAQDNDSFYHVRLYGMNDALEIYRFDDGANTRIAFMNATDTYNNGEVWSLKVALIGDLIEAWLYNQDGTQVAFASATDSTFASGSVGLRATPQASYKNFRVLSIPSPAALPAGLGLFTLTMIRRRRRL
ncbi:LamG domain-containing protein [Planctomycetales bacterium ZRK34]|nr:LamG domain-containing protein [Planctomycetales bacterium ZRK34]